MAQDKELWTEYVRQTGQQLKFGRKIGSMIRAYGFVEYINKIEGLSKQEEYEYTSIVNKMEAINKSKTYGIYEALIGIGLYVLIFVILLFFVSPSSSFSTIAVNSFIYFFIGSIIIIVFIGGSIDDYIKQRAKTNLHGYEHYKYLRKNIITYKRSQLSFWSSLNGIQFENEVARVFQKCGYSATVTKGSGDQGVDINMSKDGQRIIVQCKAHQKKIGTPTIRDLYGTLLHSGSDKAFIVSLSGFSQEVDELIIGKSIELFTIDDIIRLDSHH